MKKIRKMNMNLGGGFLKGIIYFHVMNDINNYNVLAFSIKF